MANFKFTVTVPLLPGAVESACLGSAAGAPNLFADADVNKAVKLAGSNNYVLAADGNDLEAVCVAVAPHTANNGFSFGSVQRRFTELEAVVAGAALAVGATVVCAAQNALGTAQTAPIVKAGAGALFKWRVKGLLNGTGQIGETILIEPITR